MKGRVLAARALLRCYPAARGRWRLAQLLVLGARGTPAQLAHLITPAIPKRLVRCRHRLTFRMFPDGVYLTPFLFGEYEPANTRAFRRLVPPGATVLDVGANFGWYTCLFSRWVGPHGRVVAFEPLPHHADLAQDGIQLNATWGNVTLERTGLGDAAGELIVHTFRGLPHGHASVSDLGRSDAHPHRCPVRTLDDYARESGLAKLAFLKIDVEGFEREVLAGASETLSTPDAPVVHFEVNEHCLAARGIRPVEVHDVLREAGYDRLWKVTANGRLRRILRPDPSGDADYIAAKHALPWRGQRWYWLVVALREQLVSQPASGSGSTRASAARTPSAAARSVG